MTFCEICAVVVSLSVGGMLQCINLGEEYYGICGYKFTGSLISLMFDISLQFPVMS